MATWNTEVNVENIFKVSEKVSKVAKLFAEENLIVNFSTTAKTASFFPASRTLQMPYNIIMLEDDDIATLFMTHEVGHAFWSSSEAIDRAGKENINDEENIIDDIRIERKQKHKYPGLIAVYDRAYRKLYERGFFGDTAIHPFLSFANRLNIVAKCGHITAANITLTKKELEFYHRCMEAETEDDVFHLAVELSKWETEIDNALNALKGMGEDEIDRVADGDGNGDDGMDDEEPAAIDGDDQDSKKFIPKPSPYAKQFDLSYFDMSEEELENLAKRFMKQYEDHDPEKMMQDRMESGVLAGAQFAQFESLPRTYLRNGYFTYADFIYGEEICNLDATNSCLNSIKRSVDYMAKEFEMKKAAARLKHAKVSTTGRIDVNRVCNYRFADDIFAKQITLNDCKNHGMVILLDCSGSIINMFDDLIQQTILLVEYARKIGVKFKVFGFGAHGFLPREIVNAELEITKPQYDKAYNSPMSYRPIYLDDGRNFEFVEFLSSEMSKSEYILAIDKLLHGRRSFGSTPTIETMLYMEHIANDFFARYNISAKKMFIITDGAPTDGYAISDNYKIFDPVTRKMYFTSASVDYTGVSVLSRIFKDRHNIDVTSILVTKSRKELGYFLKSSTTEYAKVRRSEGFSKEKIVKSKDDFGNTLLVIKPTDPQIEVNVGNVNGDMTQGKAATILAKAMKSTKISQVLLRTLSESFAVV